MTVATATEIRVTRPSARSAIVHLPEHVTAAERNPIYRTLMGLIEDGARDIAVDLSGVASLDPDTVVPFICARNRLQSYLYGRITLFGASKALEGQMRAVGIHRNVPVTSGRPLRVTRDVKASWAHRPLVAGHLVYAYEGPRWSLAHRGETTVVVDPFHGELGGVPRDAIAEIPATGNGHQP